MKILITGGAGYIGSQMARLLLERGHTVCVYDNLSGGHRKALSSDIPFTLGDISDKEALSAVFAKEQFDAVLHFAGVISMAESMKNPNKYFSINTFGALNLFEVMVKHNVGKLIFSSSAGVYGDPVRVPIAEGDRKAPTNPYGQSKFMVEEILTWYDKIYNLRSISLRYFNAAGATLDGSHGEDHIDETHIIPLAIKAVMTGKPFTLYGTDYQTKDGSCVRDYVHVIDLCDAHILALDALFTSHPTDALNVGPGVGRSNREVVDMVKKVTGIEFQVVEAARRPGDADELVADSTRLKTELNWNPKYSDLETIVKTAWDWHKSHPNGYSS